jgi:hypothetical protein
MVAQEAAQQVADLLAQVEELRQQLAQVWHHHSCDCDVIACYRRLAWVWAFFVGYW